MKKIICLLFLSVIAFTGRSQADDQVMNLDHPLREISVIASETGYYPDSPIAFVGEKVRLFVTTTTEEKRCLLIPDKKIFLNMEKGKIDEGEFIATEPGVYKFHCPTGKLKGSLTIFAHPVDKRRELASESEGRVKIWFPKDRPQDY
ncbi:MAG: hypothetical protein COW01_02445 [Bdellovibrionales bacterium CG12_big_fil_rev_8_21_14_0_65_38_15]|nr:MAG: hypothetical protein COW79_08110 [Bdellovibrionales bacterium CG22_combo_CG10-13_8_21_14_all_38_13]PIQ56952.1 MAG: hypothetical protein COW01_02445 [Bdellovibrionales bacterium CG12_big_fil_rev_8_21_14_0_65_38_15]PIR29087.1 MAG: hypothetical protein COV38_12675 [Bdellovibrionales bacterium CG11_big_fil_rev_8_21_14_0_20_38_13]